MDAQLRQEIGEQLRAARRQAKLSQAAVAGQVGISRVYLHQVERGIRSASDERLAQIAAAVGLRYSVVRRLVKAGRG